MKKNLIRLFIVSVLLLLALVGCSSGSDNDDNDNNTGKNNNNTDKNEDTSAGEDIEIEFWHSLSGENGKNFEKIVDKFNEDNDNIHVKATYQGSYTDLITKVRAVGESDKAPALIQASGTNRLYMAESSFVTPVQKFVDTEDFDLDQFEENAMNRYMIDDTLYSVPFSTSNPIMYYNKNMFEEAGLDPEEPPLTLEEYEEVAQTIKDETGNYGFTMATIGWFFEELLANQNALFLDNDNGFDGEPTETLINEEPGQKIFTWLDNMNKAETFRNYGSDWEDPRAPFLAEQVGMYFDSSANTREMVGNASFEVGTVRLPVPEGVEPYGATVGGNSTYITNKVSDDEQEAAWEFIKYTVSSEVQAEWASATGYFPVTKDANDEDALKETYEEYPQMLTATEVNSNTPATPATSGPLSDDGEQFRKIVETAQEEMYEGADPIDALNGAADKINDLIN